MNELRCFQVRKGPGKKKKMGGEAAPGVSGGFEPTLVYKHHLRI